MRILIGADLVPTQSNIELFEKADTQTLLGEALETVLQEADFRIFNLEVPLVDVKNPIDKCGPNLIAPTSTIYGYKAINVNLLTLANNHILDQSDVGLRSTQKLLDEHGIAYVGAGNSIYEAAQPYIFEIDNKKIGVYACAEHEFSIAGEDKAGANPFDPFTSLDHISQLREKCDFLIVLYHGGKEHYRYPSPNLQKVCRKIVEKGADLVVCQHSHCVGCKEEYQNGTIVYGQGNFLFDHSESEFWQTSLLIEIKDSFSIDYIPLMKDKNSVRLATGENAEKILGDFEERSNEILQQGLIEEKYKEFFQQMIDNYLATFAGINRNFFFRVINKLTGRKFLAWLLKRKYKKETLLAMRNFIECEAHRELLLEGLKEKEYI